MSVRNNCVPRPEVLKGDLADAMFAASLGSVLAGGGESVYADPKKFFENTHPASQLKKIAETVFQRLGDPAESGAVIRISTGFGGGKSHALLALWHLAKNVSNVSVGTELVPAAMRPSKVTVAAIDAEGAGVPDFATHNDATSHSLAGELAYRFKGVAGLAALGGADDPKGSPNAQQIAAMLPDEPVLILLDEIVVYMAKLDPQGQGNLLGFVSALASAVLARRQAVLVITDPASQQAYAQQSNQLDARLEEIARQQDAAKRLEQILGRKFSDFDPIKDEAAQVIARRLFSKIEKSAAESVSVTYKNLYERVRQDNANLLPSNVVSADELQKFVDCYPFHPRLLETAQNRLSAIPDYNRGRGTLRLFDRILRDVWDSQEELELISAGDIDWSSDRIQADLLQRLNRDQFKSAVDADVRGHAAELDGGNRSYHTRVASALMLESLPMDANAAMTPQDITHAVLRPEDAGEEPSEALDRLLNACWFTYPSDSGDRFQFRIEPNVNKQIEEKAQSISTEDAKSQVRARLSQYYGGQFFSLVNWPEDVTAVPRNAKPILVLCDNDKLGRDIAQFENIDSEGHKNPREYINNLAVLIPDPNLLSSAIEKAKRLKAAEDIEREAKMGTGSPLSQKQLDKILPNLKRQFRIESVRAFTRLVLHSGEHRIGEEILTNDETCSATVAGQQNLKDFLEKKSLLYKTGDALDTELFLQKVFNGTPDHDGLAGVRNGATLYERLLAVPGLRLLGQGDVVRETIKKAVYNGNLVVRLSDGRSFDAKGCVAGEVGNRKRQQYVLTTVAPSADVLVALPTPESASSWFATDDEVKPTAPTDGPSSIPPPPPLLIDDSRADNWEDAIGKSKSKSVTQIKLRSKTPGGLAAFPSIAVQLSPVSQKLSLRIGGISKDGGTINMAFQGVKPSNPLKPTSIVAQVFNTLNEEGRTTSFEHDMAFEVEGRSNMADAIARAREAAIMIQQLEAIEIEVLFK